MSGHENVSNPPAQALPGMEPWSDVPPPNISKMGPEDAWLFVDCPLFFAVILSFLFLGGVVPVVNGHSTAIRLDDYLSIIYDVCLRVWL